MGVEHARPFCSNSSSADVTSNAAGSDGAEALLRHAEALLRRRPQMKMFRWLHLNAIYTRNELLRPSGAQLS